MISSKHSISSRITTISRKVPYLTHCCCCVSLINGVRATTVTALIFGVAFMYLAHSELVMENYCVVITHLCQVTAILFFAWFLALMLMLSLDHYLHADDILSLIVPGQQCGRSVVRISSTLKPPAPRDEPLPTASSPPKHPPLPPHYPLTLNKFTIRPHTNPRAHLRQLFNMFQNIRFSFRLTVWIAWLIAVWLLIKFVVFAALEFFLPDNGEHKNYLLLFLIIFQSLVGNICTIYSIWLIKSYIHQVLEPSWTSRADISQMLERPQRTSIVSSTASQISNWPIVWKSPGEVASVTSVPSRLRTNLEAKQFEERSNVIGSSSNKNDGPAVVENLFDESPAASIKDPPEGFKTPVLQILFLNEQAKNLVKHDSSIDDTRKNDEVSPHSKPEERQENNKKIKSKSQFPQVQENNGVLYLNKIKKKDFINVLSRVPQPLELDAEKNNVEISSQSYLVQDAVLEKSNSTLDQNKIRDKVKRIENDNINQQNKEQQTSPVCSAYKTPFVLLRNSET